MSAKQVLAEARKTAKKVGGYPEAIEVGKYRLEGFTLQAIAEHKKQSKPWIYKLENAFKCLLSEDACKEFEQLVEEARKQRGSIS